MGVRDWPRQAAQWLREAPVHMRRVPGYARASWAHPRRRWAVVGAGVIVVALLVWAWWPEPRPAAPPRARPYLAFTGCLLTDAHGVGGPAAAPVWAGLQDASLATHAKVQFLEVTGEQTADNAATFAASLAQSHCDLVFAAGPAPSAGIRQSAGAFPRVRFYLVGEPHPGSNISSVDGATPEATRADVARLLTAAADGQR